tara:strand:- start:405 stop:689 length:285 start_codon:yes stop_codon:yes gene_type:complete
MMVWNLQLSHRGVGEVLVRQGVAVVRQGVAVVRQGVVVHQEPEAEMVGQRVLEEAYQRAGAVANPEQGGFEHSFSCLCVDPCGSPLNRWMRVES